jgi:hypothetical protein
MKIDKIKIIPMEGCNILRFGASDSDVLNVLGEPDERENIEDEDYNSEIWYYDELGITLFLDEIEDDGLLVSGMEFEENNLELEGVSIMGKSFDEMKAIGKKANFGDFDMEEEEWGELRLSFEDKLLDFYFDDKKKLTSVSIGME